MAKQIDCQTWTCGIDCDVTITVRILLLNLYFQTKYKSIKASHWGDGSGKKCWNVILNCIIALLLFIRQPMKDGEREERFSRVKGEEVTQGTHSGKFILHWDESFFLHIIDWSWVRLNGSYNKYTSSCSSSVKIFSSVRNTSVTIQRLFKYMKWWYSC